MPDAKEAAPALEKRVLEDSTGTWGTIADAETGRDIAFSIEVLLPERVLTEDGVRCRIVDELPAGMELDLNSIRLSCGQDDVTERFDTRLDNGVLTIGAENLAGLGLVGESILRVDYTARLTSASPVGEGGSVNSARLELETDAESFVTPASRTAVLTYKLELTKVDASDHARTLAGARFVLGRTDGRFALVRDGFLYGWTDNEAAATQLESGPDGRIVVSGLDHGVYTLKETAAPSGYQGLGERVSFELRSDIAFDETAGKGRIVSLEIISGAGSSSGDTTQGALYGLVENVRVPSQIVPATGDSTQDPWPLAALGAILVGGAVFVGCHVRKAARKKYHPAHMAASLLLAAFCLLNHVACAPIRALAHEDGEQPTVFAALPDDDDANTLDGLGTKGEQARKGAVLLRGTRGAAVGVENESDIPRSTENSYINVLNMSRENAYVMVNDTENFACSVDSPTNTYINWSFEAPAYTGELGQSISSMVLYRGSAGTHGANDDVWGIDTIADTTGDGLVAIWFKDAGVLSDTGEPVSMLLKLTQYQIAPNYPDYYYRMEGNGCVETVSSYRDYRGSSTLGVPLLYIFQSAGANQTDPANARVWMNSVWCSGQMWSVSFYRSSEVPGGFTADRGYSIGSLGLSDDLLVSTATNGESYLARQYCYDLDIAGIRWLNENGSYSSTSPYVTPGNEFYHYGGAYLTRSGAESFSWTSGTVGSTYLSNASNLKSESYGNYSYWLHDPTKPEGGTTTGLRWKSAGDNHNTDWRNALASDILPSSSFAWVGTECATGINLNSQFTGTGSLRLCKSVDDGSSQAFPFAITLESPSYASGTLAWETLPGSFSYRIVDAGGAAVDSGTLQSGDTFNLSHGQTLQVTGIPEGTRYTVKELSHEGYQPAQESATGPLVSDEFVGTIVNGAESGLDITNVRMYAPADWSIVKQGDSGETLAGAEFTLCFYGDASDSSPTRRWILRSDADGRVVLDEAHLVEGDDFYRDKNGVIGLPLGVLTVEETVAPEGYLRDSQIRSYEIRDAGGSLECTVPHELLVGNTRITGTLEVSKEVRGTGADSDREFSFIVRFTLGGEPLSGVFGGETIADGSVTFALRAGESKMFTGIPAGCAFEVSEEETSGYQVEWSGNSGTITANSTATAVATNTYAASGTARLLLTKTYDSDGPALADEQFGFELHKGSPDGPLVQSTACDADGNIRFDLTFDQESAGMTHTYYVVEVNDGQSGVDYDTHAARVDVSVTDNGDGTLATDVTYTDATFTNSYRSYILPETGLGGVVGSLALGTSLVVGTVVSFVRMRRLGRI